MDVTAAEQSEERNRFLPDEDRSQETEDRAYLERAVRHEIAFEMEAEHRHAERESQLRSTVAGVRSSARVAARRAERAARVEAELEERRRRLNPTDDDLRAAVDRVAASGDDDRCAEVRRILRLLEQLGECAAPQRRVGVLIAAHRLLFRAATSGEPGASVWGEALGMAILLKKIAVEHASSTAAGTR